MHIIHLLIYIIATVLFLLSTILGQEEDIQLDPEEISTLQSQMEDMEFLKFAKYNGHFRFRIAPNSQADRWHQRNWLDAGHWEAGYRMDKSVEDDQWQVTRYAFKTSFNKIQFYGGHLRQEWGQGLLFGNSFGRAKSASQPLSIFRNEVKINYHLGAVIQDPVIGVAGTTPRFGMSHTGLFSVSGEDKIFSYSSVKEMGRLRIGGMITKRSSVDDGVTSWASMMINWDDEVLSFSGEAAIDQQNRSAVINVIHEDQVLQWGLHYRYYSPDWAPVFGEPYALLHSGRNETGVMGIIRYGVKKILITSWLDIYRELNSDTGFPADRGSDWMIQMDMPELFSGKLSVQWREKQHRTTRDLIFSGLVRKVQTPVNRSQMSFTWTSAFPSWKLKYQRLTVDQDTEFHESGQLIAFYSPDINISKLTIKSGCVFFSTDSWNSRMYAWIPGLHGEFRFPSYSQSGIEIFSKWNYELTLQKNVSFRHSYMWKNDANLMTNDLRFQFESTF